MRKIKLFLFVAAIFVTSLAYAQNITVTGVVSDSSNGEGVPFATVTLKGTMTGTSTDADGNYSINVPSDGTLVFTSIGYGTVEVAVGGKSVVNVSLEPDSELLDETIVVAYGVQKKSSFVGAATQVSGEKLEKMQTTNISNALEGAVAGVQVSSSSGSPGAGSTIQIRGIGSISASKEPLIVVDGVPYEGNLNSITQQDIESMTVLKDAAANSMYGARGSNGVILITTKRGTSGKVKVTLDAKVGWNTRAVPSYETVDNPASYYEMMWEAARNSVYYGGQLDLAQAGIYASNAITREYGLYNIYRGIKDNEIVDPATGRINPNATSRLWNDSWDDMVFRSGLRQEYSVNASGGSEKTQGYMSVSYLDDEGYVTNSGFKRFSVRGKVDHEFSNWLKTGVNIAYANTDRNIYNDSEGSNYSNLFFTTNIVPCIYPVYDYDRTTGELKRDDKGNPLYDWGETGRPFASNSNAYGQLATSKYNTKVDNVSSRGYVKVNILKNLVVTANIAYDVFNEKIVAYGTPVGGDAKNVGGRGEQETDRYTAINANQLINWTPKIGKSSFDILLGHETKKDESYYLYGHMTNFVDKTVPDFANAVVYQDLTSVTDSYMLEGFFGRAEWNYDDRYYVSASFRRDGSSRFSEEKRWGNFWSVGAAWNISNETFVKNVSWINNLKLKASYGTQGNDNLDFTKVYDDLYRIDRVDGSASLTKTLRAAPDLTWEKSNNFNVGVEGKFFDRVTLNVDYFIKKTTDMIYAKPLAPSQGAPNVQWVNDIDMQNNGVEFDIAVNIFNRKNFKWNINVNGTHYRNKITKMPSDYPEYGKQVGNSWREVGEPLYNWYLYEYAGVDPANGQALYNKYETDPVTGLSTGKLIGTVNNAQEATYVKTGKTPIPDLYGGFGTDFKFFGFDVSATFAYQLGGWTYDSSYSMLMSAGDNGINWHKDIFNRWTPQNTDTDVPRVQMGGQQANYQSTRFLTSSSYLSLRNAAIGYTLPKNLTNKMKIQSVRFYLQGENLWYLSARKGMDVRKSFDGQTMDTYSALRTISGGVTITF